MLQIKAQRLKGGGYSGPRSHTDGRCDGDLDETAQGGRRLTTRVRQYGSTKINYLARFSLLDQRPTGFVH